ncbi:iron ABC transporter permease [Fodinicola feengrottensis]|uniref:Iron ABC transporter permease n=1 Tax=Fodinicola feengrottensis TaxID=435914 RepID=A0ABP4UIS6_9ACTN
MTTAGLRPTLAIGGVLVLLAASILLAVCVGADVVNPVALLTGHLTGVDAEVIGQLRLPRVLLAALVGGMLSQAGAAYQGVFRNPLADPYLLGAAAGAGLGATAVIVLAGATVVGTISAVPLGAFVGAVIGIGGAYVLGRAASRTGGTAALLLAGVAMTAFLTAVQTALLQAHNSDLLQVTAWILGELGTASWPSLGLLAPYAAIAALALAFAGRWLDVLSVGDDEAASLGIRPELVRFIILLAASLSTAAAVSAAGLIGFVGLVVPHILRRLAGQSYRLLLPLSLFGGAAFLVLADLVSRTLFYPAEIPIGVVTAFVGAPFFAFLLLVGSRS